MQQFPFAFDDRFRLPLRVLGITPDSARVVVADGVVDARFGPWRVTTPLSNVSRTRVTGPYRAFRAIGPHLSLADRGVSFGTTTEQGLCILFRRPVPGIDPLGVLRHPGLTVTVADLEGLAAALRAPGTTAA